MSLVKINIVIWAVLILSPACVLSKLLFRVKFLNVFLPNTLGLSKISRSSLEECVVECGRRPSCAYIVYLRHVHFCQLFADLDSAGFLQNGGGGIMINREDVDSSMFTDQCSCNEGQVCSKGACVYEECIPPVLANGDFVGNMYAVGSSLEINCQPKYTEVNNQTSMKCGLSGTWSSNASCVPAIECDDMTFANGELVGTANNVGGVRTVVCHSGYEERLGETVVQCENSGSWNYTPTCEAIVECGDITFANGELVGTANGVGATRTIVCHTGYEEQSCKSVVECESSGSWNYTPTCNIICPSNSGYASGSFHIKVFHTNPNKKKRDDAIDHCISDGGSLVKINETWKMEFVGDVLNSCSTYSGHDYWTDGTDYNGVWMFSDNTILSMDRTFWHEGKPSDADETCIRIQKSDGVFLWNDQKCSENFRFICEY